MELLYDLMIGIICLASAGLGVLIGSAYSYRRGWHDGLGFRNGCDQEQQNVLSQKDYVIANQKQRLEHLRSVIDDAHRIVNRDDD